MSYDSQNVYINFLSPSEDPEDCCGSSSNECSCCPIGTVAVYAKNGAHAGCLTPNDAEKFSIGAYIPEPGYIKVFDPSTGTYLGDLPSASAIEMLNYLSNGSTVGSAEKTFNVLNPIIGPTNYYELNYSLSAGVTSSINLDIDRVGIVDAVGVYITNSTEGIIFDPSGSSTVIPNGQSELDIAFRWNGIIVSTGTYTFTLRLQTQYQIREIPVRLTLT